MLQETFPWDKCSLISGLTLWRFYFQIHDGAIRGVEVAAFLKHLLRHLSVKLLVLWSGVAIHRSASVKDVLRQSRGRLWVERFPSYAPELNPVEYMWGYLKEHEIAILCVRHEWELSLHATGALRRMRRRPTILASCWKQSELWP